MTKVYVVTKGSYSDFCIDSIFSTREKAQWYIDTIKEHSGVSYSDINDYIEVYELDEYQQVPKSPHKYPKFYYVKMDREGNVLRWVQEYYDIFHPEEEKEYYRLYLKSNFNETKHQFDNFYELVAEVNARDEYHAIKKVGDKRMELLRKNMWPEVVNDSTNKPRFINV